MLEKCNFIQTLYILKYKEIFSDKIIKTASAFIVIGGIFLIVYLLQDILIPIILGFILSILFLPLVNLLKKRLRFNDFFAVLTSVVLAFGFMSFMIFVLGNQITSLFKDLPQIQHNLTQHFENIQNWVKSTFDVSYVSQNKLITKTLSSGKILSPMDSLNGLSSVLINLVLIPIYTFLILLYRQNFIRFVHEFDQKATAKPRHKILIEINHIIRQYIVGLCIEMIIVAFLTGLGLWIIGVKYFLFLGLLTAILNLIPYIGIIVACTVSVMVTIVGSTNLNLIIGVIIVNGIVQVIDNNFLLPKIVGSKVRINALASMIAVIVGGTIAGVGGMFLALPILAVLKVVFDHVEEMNPYTYLVSERD